MELIIVTGLSGGGKTQALRCLEDMGYFCVDNLPCAMVGGFVQLCRDSKTPVEKAGSTILPRHFGQRSSCIARCTTFLRIDLILVGKPCDPIGLIAHTALIGPACLAEAIRVDDP